MEKTWSKLKKSMSVKLSSKPPRSRTSSFSSSAPGISQVNLRPSLGRQFSGCSTASSCSTTSSNNGGSTLNTCAICLGSMKPGRGHAIFTAECSHTFHFNCIASCVKHGNMLCPICRCTWQDLPFQAPLDPHGQTPLPLQSESQEFSDDEPLLVVSNSDDNDTEDPNLALSTHQVVSVKALPTFSAICASESPTAFEILVGVRAPLINEDACHSNRAPIDLVTVLDVSGSMEGEKLELLKQAVCFVISNLGPADRLSIITFSSTAQRIFPLRLMSDSGRAYATQVVNDLLTEGGTDIVKGLQKGVKVLEDRREQNPVAGILLLSDGRDTFNFDGINHYRSIDSPPYSHSSICLQNFLNLLPPSIRPTSNETVGEVSTSVPRIPVHSFGFGSNHDSKTMHAISDASGGTFSFIQTKGSLQDAFARCIGGLLSVVAQELRLTLSTISPDVRVGSILAGKYSCELTNHGKQGVIDVGDLYADEEKAFLVHVSVPPVLWAGMAEEESGERVLSTSLLRVECLYKDPLSKEVVQVDGKTVEVQRPPALSSLQNSVCLEVDSLKNRFWVAEGIAEAQAMAEKGDLEGAQSVLEERRSVLLASASAQAGDCLCNWLEAELKEIKETMGSQKLYENSGRAFVLSGLSSHLWQRATTRHSGLLDGNTADGAVAYETTSMKSMVTRSQVLRGPAGHFPEAARRIKKSFSLGTRRG